MESACSETVLAARDACRVLDDHRAALAAGDLDRAVENYAEDAVVFADRGTDRGREEIRRSLARLAAAVGNARPRVKEQVVTPVLDGRTALVQVRFSIDADDLQVADGCDVYLVRGGRIVAQSVHLVPSASLAAPAEAGPPMAATARPRSGAPAVGSAATVAEALAKVLEHAGVHRVFGIVGGPCGPLYDALARSDLEMVQTRHECGAVFAALEHHHTTGTPAAVLVTTGPGFLNALNGVAAAHWDRARLVVLSATTAVPQWGRGAAQETSPYTALHGLMFDRGLFDLAVPLLGVADLPEVARRLRVGLAQADRFLAHVSVPTSVQTAPVAWSELAPAIEAEVVVTRPAPSPAAVARAADVLARDGFAIWVGAGARSASPLVRALAERAGTRVMCSPRGKGVFPESHPLFVGVTGLGGHASVKAFLDAERPARILVLGTRLGEVTSLWDAAMVPPGGFVHVDLDPTAFGAAYPGAPTLGIQSDIGLFVEALLGLVPAAAAPRTRGGAVHPVPLAARAQGPVRPQALMDAIQRVVVDGSDAPVLSESGSAFAWTNHHLRFDAPGRYRVSMTWASMAHMTCGVVGAALGRGGAAVAVVGDGAMLMGHEISTAVSTSAAAVWVVLNDARQGIVAQAMTLQGLLPAGTEYPPVDFVALARSLGADGERVERETDLDAALSRALGANAPWVVDVAIDRSETSPMLRQRVAALEMQGARREASR